MKLRTETKHLLELSDEEVNRLFDEIVRLPSGEIHSSACETLRALRAALYNVRNGV